MLRTFAFTLAVLTTSAALAQASYDPKVAYTVTSGKTQYLYLANGDGSHAVRVATGTGNINGVDFAPGGNRVAFSDRDGIKVLSYTASNASIQINGVQLLVNTVNGIPGPPDFSPDGGLIIYQTSSNSSPNTVRAVTVPGGVAALTYPCYLCEGPRWLRSELGEAFAFLRWNLSVPNQSSREIWTGLVNADGTVTAGPVLSTTTQTFKGIEDFDTTRTRNSLLITANYPTTIRLVEFDIVSGAVADKGGPGFRAHYSADDSRIVFLDMNRAYVNSLDPAGLISRLTNRGSFGVTDARP